MLSVSYTTFETTDDTCDEHRERVLFEKDLHIALLEEGSVEVAFTRGLRGAITRCVP